MIYCEGYDISLIICSPAIFVQFHETDDVLLHETLFGWHGSVVRLPEIVVINLTIHFNSCKIISQSPMSTQVADSHG